MNALRERTVQDVSVCISCIYRSTYIVIIAICILFLFTSLSYSQFFPSALLLFLRLIPFSNVAFFGWFLCVLRFYILFLSFSIESKTISLYAFIHSIRFFFYSSFYLSFYCLRLKWIHFLNVCSFVVCALNMLE